MSDNSRNSGEHSSSDADNEVKEPANRSDSENEITSTSKSTPVAASNPLLLNLLQKPCEEDSQSSSITYASSTASNDNWINRLINLKKFLSNQKEEERRSLKRKFREGKGDKSDSSYSDEDAHPAKKQLFDTSTESAMSSQEYQTSASEPCQPLDEVSTAPTDSVVPSMLNEVPETPQGAASLEEPSSVADLPISIGSHSAMQNKSLPESSEGDQSSHVSSARKQYGNDIQIREHSNGDHEGPNSVRPRYPGSSQVRNIIPFFEALLHDLIDLKTFLDGRCIVSAASSPNELVARPSNFTASDVQLTKIDPDFGTGVESCTAKLTPSVLVDFDRTKVPELDSAPQSEDTKPTASQTPSVAAAVEIPEKSEDTSPCEAPNNDVPSTGSRTLNPEIESLSKPSEITSKLNNFNANALECLDDCIDTTQSVLQICLEQGVEALHGEMEKHVTGIMNMLRKLVELRQDCSLLLKKCRNKSDRAGVTYILKVKTHIAKAYNQLLNDILDINDNFHENVQNSPPFGSDD